MASSVHRPKAIWLTVAAVGVPGGSCVGSRNRVSNCQSRDGGS